MSMLGFKDEAKGQRSLPCNRLATIRADKGRFGIALVKRAHHDRPTIPPAAPAAMVDGNMHGGDAPSVEEDHYRQGVVHALVDLSLIHI